LTAEPDYNLTLVIALGLGYRQSCETDVFEINRNDWLEDNKFGARAVCSVPDEPDRVRHSNTQPALGKFL
jgi:hypothetical protein